MTKIILGLGSNLGNKMQHLSSAVSHIGAFAQNIKCSAIWESAAVLPEGAPADWDMSYYNMALLADTKLEAEQLLEAVKVVEEKLGRQQRARWAPREIDVDILAYGETCIETDTLAIPHPYLLERDFALLPFAELWPDWKYPVEGIYHGKTAEKIAQTKSYGAHAGLKKLAEQLDAA